MRFRKRVKIVKGVSLNFSSSGTSLTLGGRGASVNIGKKGTYLNTSIPGLGLYDRTKISGSNSKKNNYSSSSSKSNISKSFDISYNLEIDENGKPILLDSSNRRITNESIIRKIKATQKYKNLLKYKQNIKQNEIEQTSSDFINIYKLSPKLVDKEDIQQQLKNLKVEKYIKKKFLTKKPEIEDIKNGLKNTAKNKIKSLLFWSNAAKRKKYVEDNLSSEYEKALSHFESAKKTFNENETKIEESKNEDFLNVFNFEKSILENYLFADSKRIESDINEILLSFTLPAEFSVDYEFDGSTKSLMIDLDLPEIEDLPSSKVNTLASGAISIKEKTQKELKNDYATCVIGIAFFLASNFYNISCNIENIKISGYTQRIDKKSGNIADEYVYSIIFQREIFKNLNIQNIEPIEAIQNFKHKINILANFDLKTITPLD